MAIKLGTKVVITKKGFGASPMEMNTRATIVKYRESIGERYFKNGAYYLNPPLGNNLQYDENSEGWGVSEHSFSLLGGKAEIILKDTYFVITSFGNIKHKIRDEYALHTIYKQAFSDANASPEDPRGVGSLAGCPYFGYGETAKKANTRMRYATPEEMRLYIQRGSPVYIGNRQASFNAKFVSIGCSKSSIDFNIHDPLEINTDISRTDITSADIRGAYISGAGNANIAIGMSSFISGGSGEQLVTDSGGGTQQCIDLPETKERRLEKLTQEITMAKPTVIPVKKKKIKRLI